jgi:hypothetical protein
LGFIADINIGFIGQGSLRIHEDRLNRGVTPITAITGCGSPTFIVKYYCSPEPDFSILSRNLGWRESHAR